MPVWSGIFCGQWAKMPVLREKNGARSHGRLIAAATGAAHMFRPELPAVRIRQDWSCKFCAGLL